MKETGRKNKKYSPEFKISVIQDMRNNNLVYNETMRKYNINSHTVIPNWERIYLEEGEAGFYIERRGRTTKMDNPKKGKPRKKPLDKQVENDLMPNYKN